MSLDKSAKKVQNLVRKGQKALALTIFVSKSKLMNTCRFGWQKILNKEIFPIKPKRRKSTKRCCCVYRVQKNNKTQKGNLANNFSSSSWLLSFIQIFGVCFHLKNISISISKNSSQTTCSTALTSSGGEKTESEAHVKWLNNSTSLICY